MAITREIGDRRGEGQVLGNLGLAYADPGEPRQTIKYFEQDLAIAREIGDRRGEGSALGGPGLAELVQEALGIDKTWGFRVSNLPKANRICV